jgi:transcriptional regulator with XRE-family HTH domain
MPPTHPRPDGAGRPSDGPTPSAPSTRSDTTSPSLTQQAIAATLRRLRGSFSQEHLAERIDHSREYVSAVERCRRWPSHDFLRRCDTALHADGELVSLWPALVEERRRRRRQPRAPSHRHRERRTPPQVADHTICRPVGSTRADADTETWPLYRLVGCGQCGAFLEPAPATPKRRFYRCADGCLLGLFDAQRLEAAVIAAVLDRHTRHLAGLAVRRHYIEQTWWHVSEFRRRRFITDSIHSAVVFHNDHDRIVLTYHWHSHVAQPDGRRGDWVHQLIEDDPLSPWALL